jgi:dTDP-4-amino-4,6-dideoxygalactose transaminase
MVTTNDEELYKKLKQFRSHGMVYQGDSALIENHGGWYMELQELGYNYRMPDVLCNLGISQLKRANEGFIKRQEIAERYDKAFANSNVKIIIPKENFSHAYHLYVIQVEDRKGLYDYLRTKDIFAQVHYVPVHLMPYYKNLGSKKGDCQNAEKYYEHCLSIPMYPTLTYEEQTFVIQEILNFVG